MNTKKIPPKGRRQSRHAMGTRGCARTSRPILECSARRWSSTPFGTVCGLGAVHDRRRLQRGANPRLGPVFSDRLARMCLRPAMERVPLPGICPWTQAFTT